MRFVVPLLLLLLTGVAAAAPRAHFLCEDGQLDIFPSERFYCEAMQSFRRGFDAHALSLFKRSAGWGNKLAQYKVGLMYLAGMGTEADAVEAAAWLLLANERNTDEVTERLRSVMASLPEFAKRQARKRAEALREDYGDLQALERRSRWVRRMKARTTGSRLGKPMSAVRIVGNTGVTSDQRLARLDAYESVLRDIVTTVEYRDFKVFDVEPE